MRHRRRSAFPCVNADSTSRAGSPLLFGLAPRGVFRAPDVATGAVGSYPTFSPLPNDASDWKTSRRFFLRDVTVLRSAGGIFSVALSVTLRVSQALACAPHCAPWRYQARRPFPASADRKTVNRFQDGVRTFLPPSHLAIAKPAITRPARQFILYTAVYLKITLIVSICAA